MKIGPSDFNLWHGLVLIFLLFAGIPWYWPDGTLRPFIIGLPVWAFVSLIMSIIFAAMTAWFIMRFWKDDE